MNLSDWSIDTRHIPEVDRTEWCLTHDNCQWHSSWFEDGEKTIADVIRWIGHHNCKSN